MQNSIQSIGDRAMLVHVQISKWGASKTDKKITAEVTKEHGVAAEFGRYSKKLIDKRHIEPLSTLESSIRAEHYRRTLPWADDGARILTQAGFEGYATYMRDAEEKWKAAVQTFLDGWDSFVADARIKLNGTFDQADYPSVADLRLKFGFRWLVNPVPTADDFRVQLSADEVDAIRAQMDRELQGTVSAAMQTVWKQMKDVVSNMAEKLKAYNPHAKERGDMGIFRDSLVTNITDLLALIPSLNLTNDPKVREFADEMHALVKYGAQELRDNRWKREDVAQRADAILNNMSAFIG